MIPDHVQCAAIGVTRLGIAAGQTPFGAVIATASGEVIVEAHNEVRLTGDITAHAEIVAIRRACQQLGTIDLSGHGNAGETRGARSTKDEARFTMRSLAQCVASS